MKKPLKITIVAIVVLIPLYLLVAFLTRDLGRGWCDLSFGHYDNVLRCTSDYYDEDRRCTNGPDKVCSGGLFNPGKARNDQAPEPARFD